MNHGPESTPEADRARLRSRRGERGTVTAEFAVVLPAVAAVLVLLLTAAAAGAAQLSLEKAAQAAVRQLSRGEPASAAAATVRAIAGAGATVMTDSSGGWVTVRVAKAVPGPWQQFGGWSLAAEATGPAELPQTAGPELAEAGRDPR